MVSRSLPVVFSSNRACLDPPQSHKVAYVTSPSTAVCAVPSHIQNIQTQLFDLFLVWTLCQSRR